MTWRYVPVRLAINESEEFHLTHRRSAIEVTNIQLGFKPSRSPQEVIIPPTFRGVYRDAPESGSHGFTLDDPSRERVIALASEFGWYAADCLRDLERQLATAIRRRLTGRIHPPFHQADFVMTKT